MRESSFNLSDIGKRTNNPIRIIVDEHLKNASENLCDKKHKKKFVSAALGDPTINPSFHPPKEVLNTIKKSIDGMSWGYLPSIGSDKAREAIARKYSNKRIELTKNDVVIASGCSGALLIALSAVVDANKNVIIPEAGFPIYKLIIEHIGSSYKYYKLESKQNWEIDIRSLEDQIGEKTTAIVVCNPSNPCGSVWSSEHIKKIINIAEKFKLTIIADETYEKNVFAETKFKSFGEKIQNTPILICNGISKSYFMPGSRLGWIIKYDRNGKLNEIWKGIESLTQVTLGASSIIQEALPEIFATIPRNFFIDITEIYRKNVQFAFDLLKKIKGLNPLKPQATFYMLVQYDQHLLNIYNDNDFVSLLLKEENLLTLPGSIFGIPCFIRLSLVSDTSTILEICSRIESFVNRRLQLV